MAEVWRVGSRRHASAREETDDLTPIQLALLMPKSPEILVRRDSSQIEDLGGWYEDVCAVHTYIRVDTYSLQDIRTRL